MRKSFYKSFIFITLSIFALLLSSCSEESKDNSSIASIKQRGVLRVAVFSDKPPFGYIDKNGQSQGYDIELAKRLAKELLGDENKVEFVFTEAQHRVDLLKSNKVDITLANFTITPERSKQVDFADPYMKTAIGVISNKNKPIISIEQLDGETIIVNKGTTAETFLTKNYPKIKLLKFDHNSEAFSALQDGRGIGLAHDNTLLYAWVRNNPKFIVSLNPIGPTDYIAPAVKKRNANLVAWLNTTIEKLQAEEFFHQDFDKTIRPFYGKDIDPDTIVIDKSNLSK